MPLERSEKISGVGFVRLAKSISAMPQIESIKLCFAEYIHTKIGLVNLTEIT